ncbi:hypothetical protein QJQ45_008333, partial [Haematococcus lacustris]
VWRGPGGEGEELWDMLRPRLDTLPDHFLRAANFHIGVHPQHPPLRLLRELRQLAHAAGGVLSVETYTGCEGPASPQQLQASGAAASPLSPHTAALACGLQALLSSCDLFSPNELEAASLLGPAPPGQMATELLARAGPTGAGLVVVRCGAQGVVAASRAMPGQLVEVPAVPDTQVEDVTGAGNAFCGGLLAALHHTRCAPWLCGVTAAGLEQEPGRNRPSPAAASPPPLLADLVVGARAVASGGDSGASLGHGGRASGASGASTLPSAWSACDSGRPGLQGAGAALRQAAVWGVAAASLVVEVPGLPQPPLARLQQRVQGRVDAMRRQLGLPLQACRQPQAARLTGSDRFAVHRFHHIEFWCSDATNTYKRFQHGLGMTLVAKSDQSTGNSTFASYVLRSNDLVFTFTAPYSRQVAGNSGVGCVPLPHYDAAGAHEFVTKHGLAVRAVGLVVDDASAAFEASVQGGGRPALPPTALPGSAATAGGAEQQVIAEVMLYGDVVLRYVSSAFTASPGSVERVCWLCGAQGPFLAGYTEVTDAPAISFGLQRLDHAVGNVPQLGPAVKYIMGFTGFHEFAEFVAEDVGTLDSGLNSVVLANNNEYVLLPVNEPTFGTPRKSQIQTYLEQNEGAGLQHLALKTSDIFGTLRQMQARSECGGFEFMPRPSDKYYEALPGKVAGELSTEQLAECKELGILVDRDDQGLLLQIFTKPLGDRATIFIEIIQRVGCMLTSGPSPLSKAASGPTMPEAIIASAAAQAAPEPSQTDRSQAEVAHPAATKLLHSTPPGEDQAAGCGGFGKGNFSELFKRIEDYERTLTV